VTVAAPRVAERVAVIPLPTVAADATVAAPSVTDRVAVTPVGADCGVRSVSSICYLQHTQLADR